MLTSIVGTNWGDEGKGRMVDLLSQSYDVVVRYQGGNNAGHTVVNEYGKTVLNLLPSGILRPDTANVLGPGMVVDLEHLSRETQTLKDRGVEITPEHIWSSAPGLPSACRIIGCWMCWRKSALAAKNLVQRAGAFPLSMRTNI